MELPQSNKKILTFTEGYYSEDYNKNILDKNRLKFYSLKTET